MSKVLDHNTITMRENKGTKDTSKKGESDKNIHWSITENGAIIARLTTFIYHKIISSSLTGGLQNFIKENCLLFKDINNENEFQIEHTEIFQQYERYIDQYLEEFCQTENLTSKEIYAKIQQAITDYPGASKNLESLLAASDYMKFVKMMKRKAIELEAGLFLLYINFIQLLNLSISIEAQEKVPMKTESHSKSEGKYYDDKWEEDEEK